MSSETFKIVKALGTRFVRGKGAKDEAKRRAALVNAQAQVQWEVPSKNDETIATRIFGFFQTWEHFFSSLDDMESSQRNFYEIIDAGKPCKPFLDIDSPDGFPSSIGSVDDYIARVQTAINTVMKADVGVELPDEAHVISRSVYENSNKVSLHWTINYKDAEGRQLCYRAAHTQNLHGAWHLAERVKQVDPEVGAYVDTRVYSRDRAMRLPENHKFGKDESSSLVMIRGTRLAAVITNICSKAPLRFIDVPDATKVIKSDITYKVVPRIAIKSNVMHRDWLRNRMLELLKLKVHPTAYHDPSHGHEDAYDPVRGVKFNHHDRDEMCLQCGRGHRTQNLRCWVNDYTGDIMWKCYGAPPNSDALRLGPLHAEDTSWRDNALLIDQEFLHMADCVEPELRQLTVEQAFACERRDRETTDAQLLRLVHDRWAKDFIAWLLRSNMGTGKTHLIKMIIKRMEENNCKTVLFVTYRRSLASEHKRGLEVEGFVNYETIKGNLSDRTKYPRVICQIESLHRLWDPKRTNVVPYFDMVVVDEIEGALEHFGSSTMKTPRKTLADMGRLLKNSSRVMAMDGTLSAATCAFFEKLQIKTQLVINTFRNHNNKRTIWVHNNKEDVMSIILERIRAEKRVVVCCMTPKLANDVLSLPGLMDVLTNDDVAVYTRDTADEDKRNLVNIAKIWKTKKLVIYTPTIEAGTDFSEVGHFDNIFGLMCDGRHHVSYTGFVQMMHRVRNPTCKDVICFAPSTMNKAQDVLWTAARAKDYIINTYSTAKFELVSCSMGYTYQIVDGERQMVTSPVDDDLGLCVQSYNVAKVHNSWKRFIPMIQDVAEEAGHALKFGLPSSADEVVKRNKIAKEDANSGQKRRDMLLSARQLTSEEYKVLKERKERNDALTTEEMRACDRYTYMNYWGLSDLTQDVFDRLGDRAYIDEMVDAEALMDIRWPPTTDDTIPMEADRIQDAVRQSRVRCINEVIHALGFKSILDTETKVVTTMKDAYDNGLKDTTLFKARADADKWFGIAKSRVSDIGESERVNDIVYKRLNAALKSCGAKMIVSKRTRVRNGKELSYDTPTFTLCSEAAIKLAQRVFLRTRGRIHQIGDDVAREYVTKVDMTPFDNVRKKPSNDPVELGAAVW